MKTPIVTKAQLDEIVQRFPTPFHIYDEAGIRENAVVSIKHSLGTPVSKSTLP